MLKQRKRLLAISHLELYFCKCIDKTEIYNRLPVTSWYNLRKPLIKM